MKKTLILFLISINIGICSFAQYPGDPAGIYPTTIDTQNYYQVTEHLFEHLDLNHATTGILFNKSYPLSNPFLFQGTINDTNAVNIFNWYSLYGNMYLGALDPNTRLPEISTVNNKFTTYSEGGAIPIAYLLTKYNKLNDEAVTNGNLIYENEQLFEGPSGIEGAFDEYLLFAAAPKDIYSTSLSLNFRFHQDLVYKNTTEQIIAYYVDFDDGIGYQEVDFNEAMGVEYESEGYKDIKFKIILANDTELESHSLFLVKIVSTYNIDEEWTVTATQSYNGIYAKAKVSVIYACGNNKLTKPLIVTEGFDPPQVKKFSPEAGFNVMTFLTKYIIAPNNLYNDLNINGYDIVFIDYEDGSTYIQANAYLVEEVIRQVNAKKAQNGSVSTNTVMGISMGGLVARYALKDMEINSQNHETDLYISFDSPHNGAIVALGMQFLIDHTYNAYLQHIGYVRDFIPDIASAYDILHSPAASQMVLYQTSAQIFHPDKPNLFNDFMDEINALGWPQNCRKIALINGSDEAEDLQYSDPAKLISINSTHRTFIPLSTTIITFYERYLGVGMRVDLDVWCIPDQNSWWRKVYDGEIEVKVLWNIKVKSNFRVELPNDIIPFDKAPGGIAGLYDLTGNQLSSVPGLYVDHSYFTFVPSVSSTAIKDNEAYMPYYNINANNVVVNNKTHFSGYEPGVFNNVSFTNNQSHTDFNINHTEILTQEMIDEYDNSLASSISNTSYNFTKLTTNRIYNLNIGSNGKIKINEDSESGYTGSGLTNPSNNSEYVTYVVEDCDNNQSVVVVENTGEIVIGDYSVNNTGRLVFSNNTVLRIKSGGTIKIENNSKLIIAAGAKLVFEQGASIELNGTNSVLEIEGELILEEGAVFSRNGTGFVKFVNANDESLQIGLDALFHLDGTGKTDKVMEITNGELLAEFETSGRKEIKITNALVQNDGMLKLASKLELNNVKFIGTGFGIMTYGQSDILINNCLFTGNTYGIFAAQSDGNHAPIEISNSIFENSYGMYVYDNGFSLTNCSFIDNPKGFIAENISLTSNLNNVSFSNSGDAIDIINSGSAEILLESVNIYGAIDRGLNIINSNVNVVCSNIESSKSPIILGFQANLDLSKANGGSFGNSTVRLLSIDGYQDVFKIEQAEAIYLHHGYNNIIKDYTTDKYFGGIMYNYATFVSNGTNVNGERNLWFPYIGASNTLPTTSDYIFGFAGTIDFNPIRTGTYEDPCEASYMIFNEENSTNISNNSNDILDNCNECASNKINGYTFNSYLKKLIKKVENDTLQLDTYSHIVAFDSIMNHPINENIPKLRKIKERAFEHYLTSYYKLQTKSIKNKENSTLILQKAAAHNKVLPILESKINTSIINNDTSSILSNLILKANLYLSENKNSEAITIFNSALQYTKSNSLEEKFIFRQLCLVDIEMKFLNKLIKDNQIDSLIKTCPDLTPNNSTKLGRTSVQKTSIIEKKFKVSLKPNPANDYIYLDISRPDYESDIRINIYSASGILLHSVIDNTGKVEQNSKTIIIPVHNLIPGVYVLDIQTNNEQIRKRIAVMR